MWDVLAAALAVWLLVNAILVCLLVRSHLRDLRGELEVERLRQDIEEYERRCL